jgi:hypothetical protein
VRDWHRQQLTEEGRGAPPLPPRPLLDPPEHDRAWALGRGARGGGAAPASRSLTSPPQVRRRRAAWTPTALLLRHDFATAWTSPSLHSREGGRKEVNREEEELVAGTPRLPALVEEEGAARRRSSACFLAAGVGADHRPCFLRAGEQGMRREAK